VSGEWRVAGVWAVLPRCGRAELPELPALPTLEIPPATPGGPRAAAAALAPPARRQASQPSLNSARAQAVRRRGGRQEAYIGEAWAAAAGGCARSTAVGTNACASGGGAALSAVVRRPGGRRRLRWPGGRSLGRGSRRVGRRAGEEQSARAASIARRAEVRSGRSHKIDQVNRRARYASNIGRETLAVSRARASIRGAKFAHWGWLGRMNFCISRLRPQKFRPAARLRRR
jgi:hypothetical protein